MRACKSNPVKDDTASRSLTTSGGPCEQEMIIILSSRKQAPFTAASDVPSSRKIPTKTKKTDLVVVLLVPVALADGMRNPWFHSAPHPTTKSDDVSLFAFIILCILLPNDQNNPSIHFAQNSFSSIGITTQRHSVWFERHETFDLDTICKNKETGFVHWHTKRT